MPEKSLFEKVAEASKPKPYQNLTEKEAQEVCDVYFNCSIDLAIASLKTGLNHAKKIRNLKLVALLEKDIATYCDMFNKRELKKLERLG